MAKGWFIIGQYSANKIGLPESQSYTERKYFLTASKHIQFKRCNKQYIGETERTLRERFKEHRQATNNPLHANATVAVPSHFNQPGQTWNLLRWNYNSQHVTP